MDLIPACVGKINFKYLIEHNGRRYVALRKISRNLINSTNDKIYKKLI